MKLGSVVNKDFNGVNGVIYRIDADNLYSADEIFKLSNIMKFKFKTFIKSIVGN